MAAQGSKSKRPIQAAHLLVAGTPLQALGLPESYFCLILLVKPVTKARPGGGEESSMPPLVGRSSKEFATIFNLPEILLTPLSLFYAWVKSSLGS